MNIFTGIGNLTRDIEFYTKDDFQTASSTLALNSYYKDKESGEKVSKTCFLDIKAFGGIAKNMKEYLSKGSKIAVSGKLEQEEWEDKETKKKRTKIVCIIDNLEFLDKKSDDKSN